MVGGGGSIGGSSGSSRSGSSGSSRNGSSGSRSGSGGVMVFVADVNNDKI